MQTKSIRRRTIKKISGNGLAHIHTQLLPSVRLSDNTFAQRLGDKTAIRLLGDFKNEFAHDDHHAISL